MIATMNDPLSTRGDHLSRRQVALGLGAAGLGLLLGCGVGSSSSQPSARVARVGFLSPSAPTAADTALDGLRQGLAERGWVEGRSLVFEQRYAEDQADRLPGLAAELAHLPVDVIVAVGGLAITAAKAATSTVPIVMSPGPDPVGQGYVASFAHPGGNITGVTNISPELSAKRLELLHEAVPSATRVAVLWHPEAVVTALSWRETQAAASALGLQLQSVEVHSADDFAAAFATLTQAAPDALIMLTDPLINDHQARIALFALERALPTMYDPPAFVHAGGLMAYGPNRADLWRRAATYVDRILRGASPADVPVEQPMTFDLVVNLNTARALGLTFPREILLQVTEAVQ